MCLNFCKKKKVASSSPIMLWTSLKDNNVSPAQTRSYFLGLKRLGKGAVLLEYPLEGHSMIGSESSRDLNVRTWPVASIHDSKAVDF
ncbi:alpha/beta hydrolase family protein [Chryseobacterium antibioticum]|uniref:alpha/beta hydrolase family protein n=1 Tax=Chryseobacterium antibioticum TaxID=2728847 RepID=UPI00293BF805|nr:prolyl oligopeptidase family serine peptidase [Chryseobacterium antibioticum]